jgi:hypothetical protein
MNRIRVTIRTLFRTWTYLAPSDRAWAGVSCSIQLRLIARQFRQQALARVRVQLARLHVIDGNHCNGLH